MSRANRQRFIASAATMLLATGIAAWPGDARAGDDPKPKSTEAKPAGRAEKAGEKIDKAAEKASDKIEKAGEKAADKADKIADKIEKKGDALAAGVASRAERMAKQREAMRERFKTALKGPMTEAMRQEVRRHARRVARLERIKSLAAEQKDKETVERADKLLEREKARHDKWMSTAIAATTTTTTTPAGKPPDVVKAEAPKEAPKGGAR